MSAAPLIASYASGAQAPVADAFLYGESSLDLHIGEKEQHGIFLVSPLTSLK